MDLCFPEKGKAGVSGANTEGENEARADAKRGLGRLKGTQSD